MAKTSMIAREQKRIKLEKKYRERRNALRKAIKKETDIDKVLELQEQISKLPVNSSPSRITKRCQQCGRPHAVYRKFALCRICLRQLLMTGNVTGGRKSSW
ncbi:30S ribosomal protein S14 [Legionella sp. W05-934-2]|uniref:30S ribosomal protein S14 n=1 Tax=Legionella sp. W05-934-2 TaxID=1198649 RepID=UPI003462C7B6